MGALTNKRIRTKQDQGVKKYKDSSINDPFKQ